MLTKRISAPFNCDSIEVNDRRDKVFVGMYQYEESTSERGGGYFFTDPSGDVTLTSTQEYGCLDAKWLDKETILLACSDGVLRTVNADSNALVSELAIVERPSSTDTQNIIMTVDGSTELAAAITAKGKLSVIKDLQSVLISWQAHPVELESWCCALTPNGNVVASGADDCCLKLWDARMSDLIHNDKRHHAMGVTCLDFLSDTELLTGSYDERIRKFDTRNMSVPVYEYRSIGGIWRLKPADGFLLVAACYGGCQVLKMEDNLSPIVSEYTGHESMAYGIGYLGDERAVSCSFYDKSVQFWSFNSNA